jgi:hypothetical protein
MAKVEFKPVTTKRFEKDVKLARKRGKDLSKLRSIIDLTQASVLINQKYLFLITVVPG